MTIQTLKFVYCAYFQYITTYGGTIRKIQNIAKSIHNLKENYSMNGRCKEKCFLCGIIREI